MALGRKRSTLKRNKPPKLSLVVDDEVTNEVLRHRHSKRTLLQIRSEYKFDLIGLSL